MAKEFVRVGRLSLIKSRPHDAEFIADDLRLHDLRECLIHGLQPLEALTEPFAVDGAHTYTLQNGYEYIENFVPADHHDTIMWLSWCGFVFDDNMYEMHGHTMMRFVRCTPQHNDVIGGFTRPVMH